MTTDFGYVLPQDVHPPDKICIQVEVPNERYYIAAFWGQLWELTRPYNHGNDAAHTALDVASVWLDVYNKARKSHCEKCDQPFLGVDEGSEDMIRQNPDNPCLLESSINGVDWCKFADISLCKDFGTQQGDNAPKPAAGGGSQKYCTALPGNGLYFLPPVVNTGDIITLESASGAWYDGTANKWYCPNGNQYFDTTCQSGTGATSGSDPLNTVSHMSLIMHIGSAYYELTSLTSPFTVPSGVVNQPVTFQPNDNNLSDNSGSVSLCVTLKNNQATTWEHIFDFTTGTGGWSAVTFDSGAAGAVWVAGIGWESTTFNSGGYPETAVVIKNLTNIPNLTSLEYFGNYTFGAFGAGGDYTGVIINGVYVLRDTYPASFPDGAKDILMSTPQVAVTNTELFFQTCTSSGAPCGLGSATITKIIMKGTGANPFI